MLRYFSTTITLLLISSLLLASCGKEEVVHNEVIPTVQEVARRNNERPRVTEHQTKIYCEEKGGKLEEWNILNNKETYCVFPQGYGCAPIDLYRGDCVSPDQF